MARLWCIGVCLLLAPVLAWADISDPTLRVRLDDGSGTSAANTGSGGTNGTLTGTPDWRGSAECHLQGCFAFNGSEHFSLDILSAYITASAGTLALWVYPRGEATSCVNFWNCNGLVIDTDGYVGIVKGNLNGTDALYVGLYNTTVHVISIPYTLNTWQHIALTWNATTMTAYKNGTSVGSTGAGAVGAVAGTVQIGNSAVGAHSGDVLDEIWGFSRTLSPEEITALYTEGQAVPAATARRVRVPQRWP